MLTAVNIKGLRPGGLRPKNIVYTPYGYIHVRFLPTLELCYIPQYKVGVMINVFT